MIQIPILYSQKTPYTAIDGTVTVPPNQYDVGPDNGVWEDIGWWSLMLRFGHRYHNDDPGAIGTWEIEG